MAIRQFGRGKMYNRTMKPLTTSNICYPHGIELKGILPIMKASTPIVGTLTCGTEKIEVFSQRARFTPDSVDMTTDRKGFILQKTSKGADPRKNKNQEAAHHFELNISLSTWVMMAMQIHRCGLLPTSFLVEINRLKTPRAAYMTETHLATAKNLSTEHTEDSDSESVD